MLIPGVSPESAKRQFLVVEQLPSVCGAVGLHPWWIESATKKAPFTLQALGDLAARYPVAAIGECGLDGAMDAPDWEAQLRILELHLQAAIELELPIILHVRKAHDRMLSVLKRYPLAVGGVVHAFSGSIEVANAYRRHGLLMGVGGVITYSRARKSREAIASLPDDALVLETDAPDMPLCGFQGERNAPSQLPLIAEALAQLRGVSVEAVAKSTTDNAVRLFGVF